MVVHAGNARVSARRQVASCFARLLIASATSERVCPPRRGRNSPRKARGVQRNGAVMMLFDGD